MASFAQCGDGFEPAEDFFDSFALALTNRIAGTASSAIIDHAGWLGYLLLYMASGRIANRPRAAYWSLHGAE